MASYATQPLGGWRNEACLIPITVPGLDLTGATVRAQVRLAGDTPGAPLLDLAPTTDAAATGVRFVNVTHDAANVPTSHLMWQVSKAGMQGLPYAGQLGQAWVGAYALQIAGVTRLIGAFAALASPIDSDNAPANRPTGCDGTGGAVPSGVTLTIDDGGVTVSISGADLIAPLLASAQAAAAAAQAAAVPLVASVDTIAALAAAVSTMPLRPGVASANVDSYGYPSHVEFDDGTTSDSPLLLRPEAIRTWRSKAMTRLAGQASVLSLGICADSLYGYLQLSATPLALALRARFGNAGFGWASAARFPPGESGDGFGNSNNSSAVKGEAVWTQSGIWMYDNAPTGPDGRHKYAQSVGASSTLTYTGADDMASIDLFMGKFPSAGAARYQFGTGAWTAINVPASAARDNYIITIPTPPGQWAFTVETTSANTFGLSGAVGRSGKSGVLVNCFGNPGSSSRSWLTYAYLDGANGQKLMEAWRAIGLDATLFALGVNDESTNIYYGSGVSPDEYQSNMRALMGLARTANPALDLLAQVSAQAARAPACPEMMTFYADRMRRLSSELDVTFDDVQRRFGRSPSLYGPNSTGRVLVSPDNIHHNAAGGALYASGPFEALRG